MDNPVSNGMDGDLESLEISRWSEPEHTPALQAAIPPQPDPTGTTVKYGFNETMTPQARAAASRATLRLGPRKVAAGLHNLLETNTNKEYHHNTFFWASGPINASGGSSLRPPPASYHRSLKDPHNRSTYSENPLLRSRLF